MSKEIDERVVSMQFDNQHFEKNVQTSMSTLDKLKQKLHLDGASKGLENVNAAAKKTDMGPLANGVETVRAKFSAMQVVAITALSNITNQAINAGKRMVSALTIDPVKTGFQEYETQINAVQTIMANVSHKGKTLDDVNNALDELNKYADQTIYNFTEMTRNIGLFTNAGVGLDESVAAIKGFSNAAAMAGTDSTRAAGAMYQLSQAMSTGKVQLTDWKSLEQANITGERFQDTVKETARAHGIAIDDMIKEEGSFRDTLKSGWLTAELMTEALNHYTLSTETMSEEEQKANRERLKSIGYTEEQIDKLFALGTEATNAATKVKTFTQLWGVLQESAQSGWSKTWKLIFGDFEQAKSLFTPLANFFTGAIDKMSDARNSVLEGALSTPWDAFTKELEEAGISIEDFESKLKTVAKGHGIDLDALIKEFGSLKDVFAEGKISTDLIVESIKSFVGDGEEAAKTTDKITESLKDTNKYVVKTGDCLYRIGKKYGMTWQELYKLNKDIIKDPDLIFTGQVLKLSDAQLKNIGYTDKQIKALKDLAKQAEETGTPINKLVEQMGRPSGRTLLIDALANAGNALLAVFQEIKKAWQEVFPPKTTEEKAEGLYNLIERFHAFTEKMKMSDKTAEKLRRTFKGLFASLDIIFTLISGPIKIAFKIFSQFLSALDLNILDVTAYIGDAIVMFRDWLDAVLDFTAVFERFAPTLKEAWASLKDWFAGLKETENVGKYIVDGLINGIVDGATAIWNAVVKLATTIIDALRSKEGLDTHSPSEKTYQIGWDTVMGLVNGIVEGCAILWDTLKAIALKAIDIIGQIDLGTLIAGGLSVGAVTIVSKALTVIGQFSKPLVDFVDFLDDIGDSFERISKGLKSKFKAEALRARAEAVKAFAIGVALLAASVYLLSTVEAGDLWSAVGAVAVLSLIIGGLAFAVSKMGDPKEIGVTSASILAIAAALLITAFALKKLASIESGSVSNVVKMLIVMVLGIVAIIAAIGRIPRNKSEKEIKAFGRMLLSMAAAFLIMTYAIKIAAKMNGADVIKGTVVVGLVAGLFTALIILSKYAGAHGSKAGGMILKMSFAFLILLGVIKLAALLKPDDVIKGMTVLTLIGGLFAGLVYISSFAGQYSSKAGTSILAMSLAMMVTVGVIQQIAKTPVGDIVKGLIVISIIGAIFTALIYVTKYAGKHAAKAGAMLLMMSGALLILSGVMYILTLLDPKGLWTAVGAITLISACFAGLIFVTKYASKSKNISKILITLTVAIGLLAVALVALSFLDSKKVAVAAAALTAVVGVFALLIFVTKYLQTSKKAWERSLGTLIILTFIVGVLAEVIHRLSTIEDSNKAIGAALALSILISALAGAITLLSMSKSMTTKKLGKTVAMLAILTGVMAALGLILAMMTALNVQSAIPNAVALTILISALVGVAAILSVLGGTFVTMMLGSVALLALAGVMAALGLILAMMTALGVKDAVTNALVLAGLITVLVGVAAVLALIGGLWIPIILGGVALMALAGVLAVLGLILAMMSALNIQNAEQNTMLLVTLITTLTKVCIALALVGPLALVGVSAMAALTLLMVAMGALAVAIGALMTKFPALQSFLDAGIPVMVQLAGGIGEMIGAFVGGIMDQIAQRLPSIGENLSLFMTNAQGFIDGAKQVDGAVLAGVGILAAAVIALTAVDLLEGITSFLSGGTSFSTLGTELSNFMNNAQGFITGAKSVDPSIMEGVKTMTDAILSLTGANLLEAITSWFTGESSLATFGAQLGGLGTDLQTFVTNLGTFSDEQVKTVECASKAITALGSAAESIPGTGGLWQAIVGESGLAQLSGQLPSLGSNLNTFISNLGTFESSQLDTVKIAGEAIVALGEAASEVPATGGLWQMIVGESGLASLSGQLPSLGSNLNTFISNLGTFSEDQLTTVKVAGDAIVALADAAKNTPNTGGFWQSIVGESGLAALSGELPSLGTNLKNFVANLGTFTKDQVSAVRNMCDVINALSTIENADDIDSNLDDIGEALVDFADDLDDFVDDFNDIKFDDLTSAQTKVSAVASLATRAAAIKTESLKKLGEAMKSFAGEGVKGFIDSFNSDSTASQIKKAAQNLVSKFTKALTDKTKEIKDSLNDIGSKAAGELNSKSMVKKFSTAGKDVATGFANGIKNNKSLATDAGSALGKAALAAAKAALDENSPSKEMYKIGDFAGVGFVNALYDNVRYADRAGGDLADASMDGLNNAISKISDVINSDIDSQPTIRPVLDLSNIKSGAGAIGSMLSGRRTISVNTQTAGAISASMLGYQNGKNSDEVVSAIRGLRKDISNMPRNTYTIGGITYDDGSNISEAVQSLVRAARVERRS